VRKLFYWKLKQREIKLGERTVLMGVLNLTPDSFSDGGKYNDPDRAFARARERFTAKRMIDDYLDLYQSLISEKSLAA